MSETARVSVSQTDDPCQECLPANRPESCILVIFGMTGDLAQRKLIPALYHLAQTRALPRHFAILGVSRSARDVDVLRAQVREAITQHYRGKGVDEDVWQDFAARIDCVAGSTEDAETYRAIGQKLAALDAQFGTNLTGGRPGNRLFYMSVGPDLFAGILRHLRSARLIHPPSADWNGPWSRVIVEKPFGRDLASAKALNSLVSEVLDERQVYRIDHYLGKETVQNLLVFRFANTIFEPIWNSRYIEHVQVTAAEQLLVTGRGAFYDQTGVVRDIVQNHLLQLLALTLMEPPLTLSADDIHSQKVQALRALHPIDPIRDVVYGQYRGYQDVPGIRPGSRTPTYVGMRVTVDNWRWSGVPIYLRAGKALASRSTEIAITFRSVPARLFGGSGAPERPNVLVLRIQPNEGIFLKFASKIPGDDLRIGEVAMDFSYASAFERKPGEAYERLLLDAMRGDATLFMRRDEVEEAWRCIDPVVQAWEASTEPIQLYDPGSTGPASADFLLGTDGFRWHPMK